MTSDMKARFMKEEILNLTIKKKEFFILKRDFPWFHIVQPFSIENFLFIVLWFHAGFDAIAVGFFPFVSRAA